MSPPACTRTASFKRLRTRFLTTALPTFFVTVKPARAGALSLRSRTSSRNSRPRRFSPRRTARNWARFFRRCGDGLEEPAPDASSRAKLGGQTLATAIAASSDYRTAALGGHTGTETVTTLANKLGWLVCALHLFNTAVCGPSWFCLIMSRSVARLLLRGVVKTTETTSDQRPERVRLIGIWLLTVNESCKLKLHQVRHSF